MQRTTPSMPSSAEVTMTGSSRSSGCSRKRSSSSKPFSPGMSMSISTRSKACCCARSSAARPSSTISTWWPSSSTWRASSRRLTRLSSASSTRAVPARRSRMAALPQRRGRLVVQGQQRVDLGHRAVAQRRQRRVLQHPRRLGQRQRAEGVAVGLQRMRMPTEGHRVTADGSGPQRRQRLRRILQEGVHQLHDKVGAGAGLQLGEHLLVNHARCHLTLPPSAPAPSAGPAPAHPRAPAC
mmetsp:Transcript_70438/g.165885  ORF Transcript_70438/g.165885 Transcript_70438/m.165885 type:complete len:239 (-) Transcript_70438:807-1523(-)